MTKDKRYWTTDPWADGWSQITTILTLGVSDAEIVCIRRSNDARLYCNSHRTGTPAYLYHQGVIAAVNAAYGF